MGNCICLCHGAGMCLYVSLGGAVTTDNLFQTKIQLVHVLFVDLTRSFVECYFLCIMFMIVSMTT